MRILETLWQDSRYAVRMLRKHPGFALTVIITLALGIGANTTIFSVVNAVVMEPLPYKEPDRLIRIWESNAGQGRTESSVSVPNFQDWQKQQSVFEQLAASELTTFNLTGSGEPQRIPAARITANLVPTLGVSPLLGRSFLPEEEKSGNNRVALLSYGLWQRQFSSDSSLVNKTILLDGESYTVVGIMPRGFRFTGRDLWVPLVLDPVKEPWRADRANRNLAIVGRLKSDVTLDQAIAEMNVLARRLEEQNPQSNTGWSLRLRTFYDWLVPEGVRMSMLALFGAVYLLLLIACANVANLLLARAATRQQEMAVRAALGAGPVRLMKQLLIESLLLAGLAGLVGLFLTYWGTRLIVSGNLQNIARLSETHIDGRVLVFALIITAIAAAIFGLAPAWWASHLNLSERLKEGSRSSGSRRTHRLRSVLVVSEVTLAVVLLVGAGLLVRTVRRLQAVPLGFAPENVITMQVSLPGSKYGAPEQRVNFFSQLLDQLRTVPGVIDAAATERPPGTASDWAMEITIEGNDEINQARTSAEAHVATPNYFKTMGVPVLQGHEFSGRYRSDRPLELVVSESFARRYWPNEDPIGKRFRPDTNNPFGTVIGVVGDVRNVDPQQEALPAFYFPYGYIAMPGPVVVVCTSTQPESFAKALRTTVSQIDADQPVYNVRTMNEIVANATSQQRFQAVLLSLFGIVALLLVAVGVYGIVAHVIRQRTREIGIMMALGANTREILLMVIRQGMRDVFLGLILGLAGSFVLTRWLSSSIFGLTPNDPLTFIMVALLLIAVALLACYLPAHRATRVDPSTVLRGE
ncbi:MAG TPA: ABC transporter permease [Pyrinomonadaceae bacterium]|nr:ABC transporter permease [Pyrinomonadaceae bacterium]